MATEVIVGVSDIVVAQLVECAPPVAPPSVPLPTAPDTSPVTHAREATVEQTGADPPPVN
jgi:hypothetical protein